MSNFFLPFTDLKNLDLAYAFQDQLNLYNQDTRYNNSNIAGVYGSFNNIIWNGGRTIFCREFQTLEQIEQCLNNINSHGMVCKFAFTNQLLEEQHLHNTYCNEVLDLIAETNNEIVINSPLLENYIREKYPSIGLTSSITKGGDFNTYKTAIQQDYKSVVCYPRRNILADIGQLNEEDKKRIELMINNDGCGYCKIEKKHYENESYNNLHGTEKLFSCYQFHPNYKRYKEFLAIPLDEQLYNDSEYFQDLGICNYKIRGRGEPIDRLLIDYLNILFWPGVRDEIYYNLQQFDFLKNL